MDKSSKMVCNEDFAIYASSILPKSTWDYYERGSFTHHTVKSNVEAFSHYSIRPRVLRAISQPVMETTIQGEKISFPICIAPTAMQCLAHPDGELATARASSSCGICMCLSTISTKSIEDVHLAAGANSLLWFQVYVAVSWELTAKLIQRAEKSGYKAFVVTVDANAESIKYSDNFSLPPHLQLENFTDTSISMASGKNNSALEILANNLQRRGLGWNIITKLRSITSLPIILKGIQTAEDALLAIQYGVDGIWVSNHGGRQLDTVDASINMLDEISQSIQTVNSNIEIYFDGGVRYGTDILKALALGARAVFIGRPILYGLTYDGENGVKLVLEMLKRELEVAMHLSGCSDVKSVDRMQVRRKYYQSKL